MIKEEDYLKAKQIVQEYEKQLNISDVRRSIKCKREKYKKNREWMYDYVNVYFSD
jgi:hypothetical protein